MATSDNTNAPDAKQGEPEATIKKPKKASEPKPPKDRMAAITAMMAGSITGKSLTELANESKKEPSPAAALSTNDKVEQEGKKAEPATAQPTDSQSDVFTAAESESTPAPTSELEPPAPALAPTSEPEPTPTPTIEVVAVEQPIVSAPTPSATPAPAVESQPLEASELTPATASPTATTEDEEDFDLASLFLKTPERKFIVSRLCQRHYDYLSTLGAILGNRASVPEILYNMVEQFILKHDKEVQKAMTKQLRHIRNAGSATPKKS